MTIEDVGLGEEPGRFPVSGPVTAEYCSALARMDEQELALWCAYVLRHAQISRGLLDDVDAVALEAALSSAIGESVVLLSNEALHVGRAVGVLCQCDKLRSFNIFPLQIFSERWTEVAEILRPMLRWTDLDQPRLRVMLRTLLNLAPERLDVRELAFTALGLLHRSADPSGIRTLESLVRR